MSKPVFALFFSLRLKNIYENHHRKILSNRLITTIVLAILANTSIGRLFFLFYYYEIHFILILGILLIALSVIFLWINFRNEKKKLLSEVLKKISMIQTGTKYNIDLDTIRIKSNNWESSRFMENRVYDIEIKEKTLQTVLEFEVEIAGEPKQFHWPSELEPKSLEMYFAIQKQTNFYIDPSDHDNCYLDLSFIKN